MRIPSVSLYLYTHPPRFRIGFFIATFDRATPRSAREKERIKRKKKGGKEKKGKEKKKKKRKATKNVTLKT